MSEYSSIKKLIHVGLMALFYISPISAQNEFKKWYFGFQAGLDFSTTPPSSISSTITAGEACATMCDASGNLLFYCSGTGLFQNNLSLMANGSGISGNNNAAQGVLAVKQPGNNSNYYLFTTDDYLNNFGARYSIIDMSLAGGQGSVTVKNATLYTPTTEKQVAVRHCNGKDIWVVSHEWNSNKFRSYLLTSAGLNTTAVISVIGETYNNTGGIDAPGQMKISPDGRKLAVSTTTYQYSSSTPPGGKGFHLFDFDAATGVVSNSLTLANKPNAYGVEFSPDGTKLYGTTYQSGTLIAVNAIYQWNVCAGGTAAIVASQYSIDLSAQTSGALQGIQRAIDGEIYVASQGQSNVHVINNPNSTGAAIGFSVSSVVLSSGFNGGTFPNFINFYSKPTPSPFTSTINCQNVKFSVPPLPTFTSGCSTTPYPPSGYLWDFGDAASGAANSSTLTAPTHFYSTLGTYTVSLILQNACTNDTLKQIVNVTVPGPTVTVSGITTFCKGDRRVLNATGANTYSWSNSASGPAATFSPTTTTVYSVTGTATNGCTSTNIFTITVNPCLDVASAADNNAVRIYPNPAHESLHFISEEGKRFNLIILNSLGQTLIEQVNFDPTQELDVSALPGGIYFVSIQNGEQMKVMRLLKD